MSNYKCAFIGSQGSGKTTKAYELATTLKKMGKDVFVLSEVARSCPLPINEETTIEAQFWIFGKQITREQSAKAEIIISDRTLLDSIAYGYRKFPDTYKSLFPFIKEYMKTYDFVIYLPPNDGFLKDDGLRSINKSFRNEIDSLISQFIIDFDIKTHSVDDVLLHFKCEPDRL